MLLCSAIYQPILATPEDTLNPGRLLMARQTIDLGNNYTHILHSVGTWLAEKWIHSVLTLGSTHLAQSTII